MPRFPNHLAPITVSQVAGILGTMEVAEVGEVLHQTTLKLTNTPITITDDASYMWGGVQIGTFPKGRIKIEGVVVKDFSLDVLSSSLAAADGGDFSMGSTSEEDGTMDRASDINLLPKTSLDPIGTAVDSALVASAHYDGTATAMPIFVNVSMDTGDGSDAAEIVGINATIIITWANLGID